MMKTIIAALLMSSTMSYAQWRHNGVPIVDTIANTSTFLLPQCAEDGASGAIVCWRDSRSGQGLDIYAQRIDSGGVVQWQTDGVPMCTAPLSQNFPRMISDGEGGAIIVWEDQRIYAQKVSHGGQVQWAVNGVEVSNIPGIFLRPVSDGNGGVIIAWWHFDGQLSHYQVWSQRLNSLGQQMWGDSGALISSRPEQIPSNQIQITTDGHGGAVVGWVQGSIVYAQRIDSAGTVRWPVGGTVLCNSSGTRGAISVTNGAQESYLFAWSDQRPNQGFGSGVYAQRVSSAGNSLWQPNGLLVASDATAPLVQKSGSGTIILVRNLTEPPTTGSRIQRLDSTGTRLWDSAGVVVTTGASTNYRLLSDLANGTIAVWEALLSGSNLDILAQRIDSSGTPRWQFNGVHLVDDSTLQEFPCAVSDGRGGAIAAWDDQRSFIDPNTPDHVAVFAQRVSAEGIITSVSDLNNRSGMPETPKLEQNYPNPFNPETAIKFSLPKAGHARLVIYDLLGRFVRKLIDEQRNSGQHQISWDGRTDRGIQAATGMYIYQLECEQTIIAKKLILLH